MNEYEVLTTRGWSVNKAKTVGLILLFTGWGLFVTNLLTRQPYAG